MKDAEATAILKQHVEDTIKVILNVCDPPSEDRLRYFRSFINITLQVDNLSLERMARILMISPFLMDRALKRPVNAFERIIHTIPHKEKIPYSGHGRALLFNKIEIAEWFMDNSKRLCDEYLNRGNLVPYRLKSSFFGKRKRLIRQPEVRD